MAACYQPTTYKILTFHKNESNKSNFYRKSAQPVLLLPEWRHGASHRGRSRPEADGQEAALLRGLGIHPESCKHFLQDLLNKPIDGGIVET